MSAEDADDADSRVDSYAILILIAIIVAAAVFWVSGQ